MPSSGYRTTDGLSLFARHWAPPGSRRALLVLVHGYAEHSGRYDHVARAFTDVGMEVRSFDLRGHGQSSGRRAYVETFDQYLDDLAVVLSQAASEDIPLFLFGHSMGGLIALTYVLDRAPALQGLLLSAPAIEVNPDLAPVLRRFAQGLGRAFPTLPTTRSPQGAISRDPAVVAAAEADPLNYHGRVRARLGAELLRAGADVQDRLSALTTPFLVLHGTADQLASPAWSRRLYEQADAADKTLRLYDGLYHEIVNEPERDTVLQDLQSWVAERLPGATA